jgi:hypothetical protein
MKRLKKLSIISGGCMECPSSEMNSDGINVEELGSNPVQIAASSKSFVVIDFMPLTQGAEIKMYAYDAINNTRSMTTGHLSSEESLNLTSSSQFITIQKI